MGLNIIIGFLYTPVMIRCLGQSEYGLYNTVASTISILSLLSLGFNAGYVRYYANYRREDDQEAIAKLNGLFAIIFSVIGLVALICGLFMSFHLEWIFGNGFLSDELDIAKILMVLLSINMAESFPASVFTTIISANERFVFLKTLGIIKTIVSPLVTLPLLLMGFRSITMVLVTISIALVIDLIYAYYVLNILDNKFMFGKFENGLFRELSIYTGFIAINMIVDQINWNIDKILLGRFRGTISVAVYTVGYSLFNYYMMFSTSISGMFTSRIHTMVVEGKEDKITLKNELTSLFIKVGRIQFLVLALVASGFVFFGSKFINVWVGKEYEDSFYVALLLMIPGSIALIQNIGIEMQRAQNLHHFRSIVYLFMAIVNLGLSIVLCRLYGAVGSAMGTAISLIIANGVIMNIYYHKKCNIDMIAFWKNIGRMAIGLLPPIVVGVMWVRSIGISTIQTMLLGIIVYTTAYFLSAYFVSMDLGEKRYISMLFNKLGDVK